LKVALNTINQPKPEENTNDKKIYFLNTTKGVTFLAFGNGAPDIFSAIAAIGNAKNGDAGLAFGALLGMICRIYH
jgi:Ca2+/Na+ antiporter